MTEEELAKQYQERHDAECAAGGSIEIQRALSWVAVRLSDGGEYFFQGHEADDLIDEVPDWCNAAHYILAQAQNW